MSLALYRKYRSATFADLVGQEVIASTLRNQVRQGEVAHAYLFTGIRGTGKTSSARILARAVVCLDLRDGEPCNVCLACQEVLTGRAVDVLEIDAASNRGIDEMRDLRERVKFLPAHLRRKVYIVDEAHMLTPEAWNAFLKTLEEPPDHVLFVLATTEPHKVPETVRSRVQRFDFRRVGVADLERHLARVCAEEGVEVAPEALALVAAAGQGSVRDALSVLDQAMASGERPLSLAGVRRSLGLADPEVLAAVLSGIACGDPAGALRGVATAFDQGADARQLLREMARLARAAEMVAIGYPEGAALAGQDVGRSRELAETASPGIWVEAMDRFAEAEVNLRQPVDARLQVELAVLRLCTAGDDADLATRVARLERVAGGGGARAPRGAVAPGAGEPASAAAASAAAASTAAASDDVATPSARLEPARRTAVDPAGQGERPVRAPAEVDVVTEPAAAPPSPAGGIPPHREPPLRAVEPATAATEVAPTVAGMAGGRAMASGPIADLAGWIAAFPRVVEAVSRRDPMLAGVLRSCRPVEGDAQHLVVGAPYGFHLERLRDAQKAPVLADAVTHVAGHAVTVECVFSGDAAGPRTPAPPDPDQPDATSAVLAAFPGSRVVGSVLRETRP